MILNLLSNKLGINVKLSTLDYDLIGVKFGIQLRFFSALNITAIPRYQNMHVDSLAVSASSFKIPDKMFVQYQILVKYRPSIPDNIKH